MLKDYIQDTARKTKVHDRTIYNTRVQDIVKNGSVWKLTTTTAHASNRRYVERHWVGAYPNSTLRTRHFRPSLRQRRPMPH